MSQRLENVLDQNEQMIKNDEKLGLVKEFGQLFLILFLSINVKSGLGWWRFRSVVFIPMNVIIYRKVFCRRILTKKVLDVVLSRSKKRLKDDLIHHVYQNITEEDCSYGVVYLLHQIFAKVLNHRDLDSACGTDGREDLKTLIRVSDLLFYKTCHKTFAQEIS